ncbi:Sec-independent protein translocase protein TatC [anaerobic digester metagenome]
MSEERTTERDDLPVSDEAGSEETVPMAEPQPEDVAVDGDSGPDASPEPPEAEENVPAEKEGGSPELASDAPVQPSDESTEGGKEEVHEMTFTEHLNELRIRLVRCIIGAFVGFLICYGFAEQLFELLMKPLMDLLLPTGGALIYTGLPEAFFTHLKVAAIAGVFVASPYIFYQLWMFIAPGLYEGERKYMIPIAFFSALCFVLGALFGYYVVFPYGFQFFLGYATEFIKPMPSVKEYFSFSTSMLFAFGFIFELPLFMFFLSVMGIVTHKTLRKYRKFAILGNFVVAAILTPPDVVSQCLMAGPLCVLYEIGIWVAYIFGKKPKEPEAEAAAS